nr:MAG TPA: protein of unknown function (DUF5408) [Caudoviricetes sp.]
MINLLSNSVRISLFRGILTIYHTLLLFWI